MMQFYKIKWNFKLTGCEEDPYIDKKPEIVLIDTSKIAMLHEMYDTHDISWDNIDKVLGKEYTNKRYLYPFNYRDGKLIIEDQYAFDYTEYVFTRHKNPNMKILCHTSFVPTQLSIKEIMDWPEGDKAIQYLNERGLSIIM